MLSNCDELELPIFVKFAGIESYITDTIAYGNTRLRKAENMRLLSEKYKLQHPVYIGDTDSDCSEAHRAGIPFVWMSYGFGTTDKAQLQFDCFSDLVNHFVALRHPNQVSNKL